jgi:hypothetical protein
MSHCQTFKQKIEELKGKVQSLEAFLSNYIETGDERIVQQFERELEVIIQEIEEFKEEFKNKATKLIEEFIQRRDNKHEEVKIIFDEPDLRFIIEGNISFNSRTHLTDFPNLIKELLGHLSADKVLTLDLPELRKVWNIHTDNAQALNLPNLEEARIISANNTKTLDLPKLRKAREIHANNAQALNLPNIIELRDIYFYENNPNLQSLLKQAREWKEKGILNGKIYIVGGKNKIIREL